MNSKTPIHITHGTGKMMNITSINVSSLQNEFCQRMSQNKNTVCGKCYSNRYSKMRPNLEKRIIENGNILSKRLLKVDEIPLFNSIYVRFNSFGELINDRHYHNLQRIAHHNPHTTFGLWTKRADIVMKHPKEPNIKYIYSALAIENAVVGSSISNWFDKVFYVHKKDNELINCKGKCIDCLLCYRDNQTKFIHEKIK
jgi:hypothetical protein